MKRCSRCKLIKNISEFSKDSKRKDGLRGTCKSCRRLHDTKTTEQRKNHLLKYRFNITIEDYNKLLKEQNASCKICGIKGSVLNVDHSHTTGQIRGLLCTNCNIGLGHFKDNSQTLEKALSYLKQFIS